MKSTIAQKFYRRYFNAYKRYSASGSTVTLEVFIRAKDRWKAEVWDATYRHFQNDDYDFRIFKDGSALEESQDGSFGPFTRWQVVRVLPKLKKDKTLEYSTPKGEWKNYAASRRKK